ncbi:MAG: alpha/beta fold hydrolase [Pseudomonadota bacterium]
MKTVELAFNAYGNPASPPLLILHGLFASSRNWHTLAMHFASVFRVFALDLRNHGASPRAKPIDYPHMVADILVFMDHHHLKRASLIGHSMGGKAAMWLALEASQRVDRLIVADIAPVAYGHSYAETLLSLKRLPLADIASRKEADLWLGDSIPDPRIRQFLLQNLVLKDGVYDWRIDLDVLHEDSHFILGFPEVEEGKQFEGSTLFLEGERSTYVLPEHLPLIRRLFPHACVKTLVDAGHWLHADRPEHFAARAMEFLRGDAP